MASIILNGQEIANGTLIRFKTINEYDHTLWYGEVEGIVKYGMAKLVSDVDNYYAQVLKSDAQAPPITDQEFLIVNVTDGTSLSTKSAFCVSHINETTLEVVTVDTDVDIRILNIPESRIVNAIQLLNENGFQTKLI